MGKCKYLQCKECFMKFKIWRVKIHDNYNTKGRKVKNAVSVVRFLNCLGNDKSQWCML